ncbi:MAG TPA: thioredoxin domain-containing protein [Tepidisphaeraceae bacterium]|jgi:protein-disulfide isomerase|nr:thioredoxin domain-containing protein [Tepidisphaeraceae bacterium]
MKDEKKIKLEQHQPGLVIAISEKDHAQGPTDAPVTLVEYGDYECPYCGRAYPIVKKIQQEMGDKLRFVFRNFPLNTIHEHASQAAQAAEAAGGQGKFWEMHDILYEHQDELVDADLRQYALRIGVEIYRFEKEMSEAAYANRVRDDFRGGIRSGVNGTPTFFINGERYEGKLEYGALVEAVRAGVSVREGKNQE